MRQFLTFAAIVATISVAALGISGTVTETALSADDSAFAVSSDFTTDSNGVPSFTSEPDDEGSAGEHQDTENMPPVFDPGGSFHTFETLENYGPRISAGSFRVHDPDGDEITFSLAGADAASFTLSKSEGQQPGEIWLGLDLMATPDYESPADANSDGVYEVTIRASDGNGNTEKHARLRVLDVNEAPVITGLAAVSFPELSGTDVSHYTVADPEGKVTRLTVAGTDASSFTIADGTLTFTAVPDYETKSSYSVIITASDGKHSVSLDVTITITDVDETTAITLSGSETLSIAENSTELSLETYTATDPEDGQITWSLEGADQDHFGISGGALSLNSSPDYEAKSSYAVTVKATAGSKTTARAVTVTVTDVNEAPVITGPAAVSFQENSAAPVGRYTAADPEDGMVPLTLGGTDDESFTFANDTLTFDAVPDYETKSSYSVTFTTSDGTHTVSLDVTITIIDMAEVSGLRVTSRSGSVEVSVDWVGDPIADYYLVRWQLQGPGHVLNQGIRRGSSNASFTVGGSGDYEVRVEACHDVGCGPHISQQVTVDGGAFCSRTPEVRTAIMDKGPYVTDCTDFTAEHLANITGDLLLGDYGLTAVKAGDLDGLTGISGLALNHNQLTELPEGLFDDLTGLTWLRLNNNRLTELPEDAFSSLTNLERLHLGQNRLTALPANLINGNSKLHTLTLTNNKLTSIPAGLLSERSELKTLHIEGNPLTALDAGLFEDLTNIATLKRGDLVNPRLCERPQSEQSAILGQLSDISDCKLVTHADVVSALNALPSSSVCDRTTAVRDAIVSLVSEVSACADVTKNHLEAITGTLNLQNQGIETLQLGDFDGLSGLTEVDLQNNSLTSLPMGIFKDLGAATGVKLNNNQLTTLNKLTFYGMDALNSVALAGNNLGTVPPGLFHGQTNLQKILLDSNNLTGIRADTFDGLTDLRTLHLDSNSLKRLPQGIFKDLKRLETLELDDAVNLDLCDELITEQVPILNTLPTGTTCRMVTHADLAPYARQYIEDNHITPYQDDHPWLHEAWFDFPVNIFVWPAPFPYSAAYFHGSVIVLAYPHHTGREILYHELAHHYTLHNHIHDDDPAARLSMLTPWLYFADQKARFGFPSDIKEGIAGSLQAWVVRGQGAGYWQWATYGVMASVSEQEIPQWFFNTYATDDTLATVDLDRLWNDFRSLDGNFKHQLSTHFGGYCSFEEGKTALTDNSLRNPWAGGGCVNRRPQELSAAAASSGELSVSWSAPLWTEGPATDAYLVQWKSGDQDYDTSRQAVITDLESLSYKITGLTTGAEYTVRVDAVNQSNTTDFVDNHGHLRTAEITANAG